MNRQQTIDVYLQRAQAERSAYIGTLIADGIVMAWNGIKNAADVLLSVARAKSGRNVFTFDA
jgi:hypothetical protein